MAKGDFEKNWGCAVVAGVVLLAAYFIMPIFEPTAADKRRQAELTEQALSIARVERLVKHQLRDPGSAQFRHFGRGCGTVNSRNGFGGMSGPTPFIVGQNDNVAFRETNPEAFEVVWTGHCQQP